MPPGRWQRVQRINYGRGYPCTAVVAWKHNIGQHINIPSFYLECEIKPCVVSTATRRYHAAFYASGTGQCMTLRHVNGPRRGHNPENKNETNTKPTC